MKLLNQTQRLFLWVAAPVFMLAGVAMYFAFSWAFDDFAEERLISVQTEIEDYVLQHDTLPVFFQSSVDRLEAAPVSNHGFVPLVSFDTLIYNGLENEFEPYRRRSFTVKIHGQPWQVSLTQSTLEQEDLVATVATWLLILFALLFGVMLGVNHQVSRKVWQPFFSTLEQIRRFRVSDAQPLQPDETSVDEFRELHRSLEVLTEKGQRDFRTVKQFTENASHELQTPLAVVRNKVDRLLQDEGLSELQVQQLDIIQQNVRRMARLNQSLLLLTKIENDQFSQRETVDLKWLLEKRLAWLEDFITDKQLVLQISIVPLLLEFNPFLAETLVTNLLTNAVKHNLPRGTLRIYLDEKQLIVANSGEPAGIPTSELTKRFARGQSQAEGLGLGLAIVQEICEKTGWRLDIGFESAKWTVVVEFKPLVYNCSHN